MKPRSGLLPITGSWMDFYHTNEHEGDLWNDTVAAWPEETWEAKVEEMADLGLDTVVIMSVALAGKAFYPSRLMPQRWRPMAAQDPLEAVLRAADRRSLAVYVGVGFFQEDTGALLGGEEEHRLREGVPRELADRYGHHESFAGWYLPVEEGIRGRFSDAYRRYTEELSSSCLRAASLPILIAPYGTRTVQADERFVAQLRDLPVTYIAYQDEVGVEKTQVGELDAIYRRLAEAHRQAGRPLWTDLELFRSQGRVYHSPLLPAPPARVLAQLEAESPHVDKVLAYQFLGLVNPPDSRAFAGHEDSVALCQGLREAGVLR